MSETGKLVTADEEKAEVLNTFLPQSSLATSLLTPPESMNGMRETRRVKSLQLLVKTRFGTS